MRVAFGGVAGVALVVLAACGPVSPVFTPGVTPPVYSPPAVTPATAPAAATTTQTPATPEPTAAAVPGFPTIQGAHDYAAQQGAAHFQAAVVTDQAQCPSTGGVSCYVETQTATQGTDAAYFVDSIGFSAGSGAADIVYLYRDSAGWHWLHSLATQAQFPSKSAILEMQVDSGCGNVRASPSLKAAVVACLSNGTQVTIDDGPVWAEGHIWWHLSDHPGWIIHELVVTGFQPQTQE